MDEKVIQNSSLKQIIDRMFPDKINTISLLKVLLTLKKQRKVTLKEIADLILFIADTSHREWNLEIILKSINEAFDNVNWRDVYEKFLEIDLKIWNKEYLYVLVDCWVYVSGIITVPYEIFFKKWQSRENQIEFFKILLECDEKKTQVYSNIFFEKLVTKEDLKSSKYKRNIEYENNLNSVELFKSLSDIEAIEIIEIIRESSPEYCILGLAAVFPFCEDVFDELLIQFSEGVISQLVYHILFTRYCNVILHSFRKSSDKISLTRVLDILLEHKMFPIITEVTEPVDLCFDLVILSSRRDHLNLEIWLTNYLKKNPNQFVKYLESKLLCNTKKDVVEDIEDILKGCVLRNDSEIFPFNKSIITSVLKIFDINSKEMSEECLNIIRELKSKISENKGLEKPNYSDRATTFISEVINSQIEIKESVDRLDELAKGDEGSVIFAKRVFGLLIDNYSSLYKLPNSDMIAVFLGELIRRKILFKPYLKVSTQLIKNSLKYPENDREYAFAFRILEIFFTEIPEFFFEIEDIENVKYGLIKKELIIVDEDTQRNVGLDELLNMLFGKTGESAETLDILTKEICRGLENIKISEEKETVVDSNHIVRYFFKNLQEDKLMDFVHYVLARNKVFSDFVIEKGFSLIKLLFTYKIPNEEVYCSCLGSFLGKLSIGMNKPVHLDIFDFKSFLLKSIEYRRISVSVSFICSFIKEGRNGMVFVPHNPWLIEILDLLAELYPCTLVYVREKIQGVFSDFKLKLSYKPTMRAKEHLAKYIIENDGVVRQIIAAALDFSVREICNKVVKSCLTVATNTSYVLFDRIKGENRFFLFRNLLVNLTRSLIHISAQEPLKASMCGNVTHFLKLSMNELPLENIYNIVSQNLFLCCSIIEKAGITQVNEIISSMYSELCSLNEHSSTGLDSKNSLKILAESCFVEKVNIRSIENVEYQEIRSFLIQVGKKMPTKKKDYISEEWHVLLGPERLSGFKRIIEVVSNSPDKDEMCLSLCKYLVGHALKTDCEEDYIFEFISHIFDISSKCKREVVGWLVYSEDSKKFNIPLIRKFIEYDFLCIEEFDQSLSKLLKIEDLKFLDFVLDLLDTLILQDLKFCTVYDFIYTIESLNKMNENSRVFEFFKKIEFGMMKFQDRSGEVCIFDDFIKNLRVNIPPESYLTYFKDKYKSEKLNFALAFKSSWHHFVLYSGSFRFFKVDILSSLVKDDLFNNLKESLKFLIQAYSKDQYLFFLFYCRFIVKTLSFLDDTVETRVLVWKIFEVLSPTNIPGFTVQFIEILDHSFMTKYFEKPEAYWVSKELLDAVRCNIKIEPIVLDFFTKHWSHFKRFDIYLSYLCPRECIDLKNLFNQSRPKIVEKGNNAFFNTFYLLNKHLKPTSTYIDLIEHLSDNNYPTLLAIDTLKSMIEKNIYVNEIVLLLMIRLEGKNPPTGVKLACEEIFKRSDIKNLVNEFNTKYFNKMM